MTKKAKDRAGARFIVREEMERCLSTSYSELESRDTGGVPLTQTIERTLGANVLMSDYQIFIEVKKVPGQELKRVKVSVRFGEKLSREAVLHSVVFGG